MSQDYGRAVRERLESVLRAETTLRVHVWSHRGCSCCDPRGEDLVVTGDGEYLSLDEYYQNPSGVGMTQAWELLELAEKRATDELEQAKCDLATCVEIRKRLENAREFQSTLPKGPGPFAELLDRFQE